MSAVQARRGSWPGCALADCSCISLLGLILVRVPSLVGIFFLGFTPGEIAPASEPLRSYKLSSKGGNLVNLESSGRFVGGSPHDHPQEGYSRQEFHGTAGHRVVKPRASKSEERVTCTRPFSGESDGRLFGKHGKLGSVALRGARWAADLESSDTSCWHHGRGVKKGKPGYEGHPCEVLMTCVQA